MFADQKIRTTSVRDLPSEKESVRERGRENSFSHYKIISFREGCARVFERGLYCVTRISHRADREAPREERSPFARMLTRVSNLSRMLRAECVGLSESYRRMRRKFDLRDVASLYRISAEMFVLLEINFAGARGVWASARTKVSITYLSATRDHSHPYKYGERERGEGGTKGEGKGQKRCAQHPVLIICPLEYRRAPSSSSLDPGKL